MSTVTERLESIGVKVKPYKRGPAGKVPFAITVDGEFLRLWEGAAEITVSTDKRKRQAVITVTEKPRTVKTMARLWFGSGLSDIEDSDLEREVRDRWSMREIRESARIQVPNSRMTILNVAKEEYSSPYRVNVDVQLKTRKTTTSFLVGFDTHASRPFISQLKKPVKTVQEARAELLPDGVTLKDGHKRQGEWFFNPVSQKLSSELNRNIHRAYHNSVDASRWGGTSHRAMILEYGPKTYAIGMVTDRRKGRHEPLFLDGWHEVIRNNEVEVAETNSTWD